ncbi:MAG: methylmalonyl-CoA carboxyltransferase [Deltaproteobacteria bacterium]|nr:methylmalonyl-CoA carboxyltransferase [Deltaproteobacteria bacterium]
MHNKIKGIEELRRKLLQGGGTRAIKRQHEKGKLTARERVDKLLDPSTFFEIELFSKPIHTGMEVDKEAMRGDGLVSGYGEVNGRPICVWAQDATVSGGRAGIIHLRKVCTLMERALRSRVPCVGMIDSEGVKIEDMLTSPTDYPYDKLMYLQTTASGIIPQISLIMGPCMGSAAISAQLADFVFMVRNTSYAFVSHIPSEISLDEKDEADSYAKSSGCCDLLADGDEDCIVKARELLSLLPLNNSERNPIVDTGDDPDREVPELLKLVPADSRKPFSMHKAISFIVDNGRFFEIKGSWAQNLIVGFARLGGQSVGIIANNPLVMAGCLDVDTADKMARFVRFCDAFSIPLVYLADTPAFLPSVEQERKGIIRHGAKIVFSNSVASVPQIQIYVRKCYGGGGLAMPGNNLGGDFGIAWPTSELLLMHPEGAVSIIHRKEIKASENPKEEFKKRLEKFKREGSVENVWEYNTVQDFINPKDTRARLIKMLNVLEHKVVKMPWKKSDNMPL